MSRETHAFHFTATGALKPLSPADPVPPCTSNAIATFLTRLVPYTLPLLGRLQLDKVDEDAIFVSTGLSLDRLQQDPSMLANESRQASQDPKDIHPEHVWTMALIHRAGHPATEMWSFSSLQLAHGHAAHEKGPQPVDVSPDSFTLPFSEATCEEAIRQLVIVLSKVPIMNRQPGVQLTEQVKGFGSPGVLAGVVHTTAAALLAQQGLIVQRSPPSGRYIYPIPKKYKDSPGSFEPSEPELPQGLVWSRIGPHDYADVMAANKIVRSADTIANLPSVAIRTLEKREDGSPGKAVAFAFAAGDGAIRTLHVDPAYRRQGLAKAVVIRLLETGAINAPVEGPFAAEETVRKEMEELANVGTASVEKNNIASIRTFESIGGRWHWDAYWLWLDLDRATRLLSTT